MAKSKPNKIIEIETASRVNKTNSMLKILNDQKLTVDSMYEFETDMMVVMSWLAYENFETVQKYMYAWKVHEFTDNKTGADAFLAYREAIDYDLTSVNGIIDDSDEYATRPVTILMIRGTELKLQDVKADLKVKPVKVELQGAIKAYNYIVAHSGFVYQSEKIYAAYKQTLNLISESAKLEMVNRTSNLTSSIPVKFITGHSLGGAIAQIIAVKLSATAGTYTYCTTFGSPKTFTEIVIGRVPLIRNYMFTDDIVAKVPVGFLGYRKFFTNINIKPTGPGKAEYILKDYQTTKNKPWYKKLWNYFKVLKHSLADTRKILSSTSPASLGEKHAISRYVAYSKDLSKVSFKVKEDSKA